MRSERTRTLLFLSIYLGLLAYGLVWARFPYTRGMLGDRFGVFQGIIAAAAIYVVMRGVLLLLTRIGARLDLVWLLLDLLVITVIVRLTGGLRSEAGLMYLVPVITASVALCPRRTVLAGVMGAFLYAWASWHHGLEGPEVGWLVTRMVVLAALTTTAACYAVHELRRVQEIAGLKARLALADYRDELSREMHDGIQGSLAQLAARLALAGRAARRDPAAAARLAAEQIHLVGQVADELRCLVHTLRSPPEVEHGFADRVQDYLQVAGARRSAGLSLDVTGRPAPMPTEVEHAAFRILQESLTNIEKHAAATHVRVALGYEETQFEMRVEDDGVGFNPDGCGECVAVGEHLGLLSMRQRAEAVGGCLELNGEPGSGTCVLLRIPLVAAEQGHSPEAAHETHQGHRRGG